MGMAAKVTMRRNMRALTMGDTSWTGGEEDDEGAKFWFWGALLLLAGPVRASRASYAARAWAAAGAPPREARVPRLET